MFNAIVVAERMLLDAKANNPTAKLMIFVLTDGESNSGYKLEDTKAVIKGLKVPIYTIGYNANIGALQEVSQINEAANINAYVDDVIYKIQSLFNAENVTAIAQQGGCARWIFQCRWQTRRK